MGILSQNGSTVVLESANGSNLTDVYAMQTSSRERTKINKKKTFTLDEKAILIEVCYY